jgi:hypothetical protein
MAKINGLQIGAAALFLKNLGETEEITLTASTAKTVVNSSKINAIFVIEQDAHGTIIKTKGNTGWTLTASADMTVKILKMK